MQQLQIVEYVDLSPDEMFARLADHENLGKVLGVPVKRSRVGEGDVNGLSLIHISEPRDGLLSRMPSSA